MNMETIATYSPEAVMLAYRQLVQLNLESYRPEVSDWLHSEDAKPVLKQLLAATPCAGSVH